MSGQMAAALNATDDIPSYYNLTLKLGSLFAFPSRFLARIRGIDELLNQDTQQNTVVNLVRNEWDTGAYTRRSPPPPAFTPFPGPWGFLTSGYAVGLFAMVNIFQLHALPRC